MVAAESFHQALAPHARAGAAAAKPDAGVLALGQTILSVLGATLLDGIRGYAEQNNIEVEGLPKDPDAEVPPDQILNILRSVLAMFFPLLAPKASTQ